MTTIDAGHLPDTVPTASARKGVWRVVVGTAVVALLIIGGSFYWATHRGYHFAVVTPSVLYRNGNRSVTELEAAVRRADAKTVVCLVGDSEMNQRQFAAEISDLPKQGVAVDRIPIPLGGWPTKSDVAAFLAIVNDPAKRPVLVHCAQGVRRTGMMIAAYQRSALGWSVDQTKAAIRPFGHSGRTTNDIRTFIDGYDPTTGNVPDRPNTGTE